MRRSLAALPLLLVCALALGPGCARRAARAEAGAPHAAAYYPLALGNRWTYRVDGRADRQLDVVILEQRGAFFVDSRGGQLTVDAEGVRDQERYLLRGPLEVGTRWTNVLSANAAERYRIVQARAPCRAVAGAFRDCVVVEGTSRVDADTQLVNTLTFAPGVGLVHAAVVADVKGRRIPQTTLELVRYELKPPATRKEGNPR